MDFVAIVTPNHMHFPPAKMALENGFHVLSDKPATFDLKEAKVLEQGPGQLVYVPPHWIHRSINTGDSVLTTLFCYNADAGQDYEIIRQRGGMRKLIVTDGSGGWALEDNPNYVSPA